MDRIERITIKRNIAAAVELHNDNRQNGPAATVSALVSRLGYPAAVSTVAAIVNTVGDWDGRVSPACRSWAAEIAPCRDDLRAAGIYSPSEIHPAHIDQIARAAMRLPAQV